LNSVRGFLLHFGDQVAVILAAATCRIAVEAIEISLLSMGGLLSKRIQIMLRKKSMCVELQLGGEIHGTA